MMTINEIDLKDETFFLTRGNDYIEKRMSLKTYNLC